MLKLPVAGRSEPYELKPTKIIALGLNYQEHIAESPSVKVKGLDGDTPAEPVLFAKTPNVLILSGQPIVIPSIVRSYSFDTPRTDHEAELAFIVKDDCRNIPAEEAYGHILGFTCMNDVSQRNIQNGDRSGWFRGKSFDTFGPVGPRIVLTQDIGNPQNLEIRCRLNGKTVQSSNTKHMIFTIPELFAFITRNFSLSAGDIITTGTPSGVGPLHEGDLVEVEIEKIGVLSNPVVEDR